MKITISLVIIVLTSFTSYLALRQPALRSQLLFIPTQIRAHRQWYRFLSHGFIHADFTHLLVNMYVLYGFGTHVETVFSIVYGELLGRILYILLYFLGIIAASIPSYLQNQHNYHYSALGASGAISGLMLVYTFFNPWEDLYLFFIIKIPAILASALYLLYSSYMSKRGSDLIGHDAHYYGALFGVGFVLVASAIFKPELIAHFANTLMLGPTWLR